MLGMLGMLEKLGMLGMTRWMQWILVGVVLAMLPGCGLSADTGAAPRESVTSAADTTALLWVVQSEGYNFPCTEECGSDDPTCKCVEIEGKACVVSELDGPCATQGTVCDLAEGRTYTQYRCLLQTVVTPPPPPPPPPQTWHIELVQSCECEGGTCSCIHNRCAAGVVEGGACSTLGARCNLVGRSDYETLRCST